MGNKLCVYSIAKNEVEFVDRFMDSMRGVDVVIVGDPGSTDDTVNMTWARGATVHAMEECPDRQLAGKIREAYTAIRGGNNPVDILNLLEELDAAPVEQG